MPFKVVITDTTAEDYDIERALFAASDLSLDVRYLQTRNPADVAQQASDADALIVSWAPITRQVITKLQQCRIIARYGIGVDMIDLDAATEHGIVVCNTARYCIDEVSTQTIAFILMLNRAMLPMATGIRQGGWTPKDTASPRRLTGQQLGLVGIGNIGRAVAAKARGLGLRVVAFDPYIRSDTGPDGIRLVQLAELLAESDYVSIHCPLNDSTHHLIGQRELRIMRSSAYLINCARGAIIDQAALIEALSDRCIAGAGLDVFDGEPLDPDDPLRRLDNVIATPHTAHWSVESATECRRTVVEHVLAALGGKLPSDIVNRAILQRQHRLGGQALSNQIL